MARREGCTNGYGCVWDNYDFVGYRTEISASYGGAGWYTLGNWNWSSKNRFGNRKLQLGNYSEETACLNPGGNREHIGATDRFKLGVEGSRCG